MSRVLNSQRATRQSQMACPGARGFHVLITSDEKDYTHREGLHMLMEMTLSVEPISASPGPLEGMLLDNSP